ncbi:MAG TPA: inositol monophosphatase family protein [Burkholderiales bacterium]|nr:inositol monophosphatase family protein [Burkholderiales bacterium]
MIPALSTVVAAVEAEGERLREEFYRPDGPRGRRGDAPVDLEIENRLKEKLQALLPSDFAGEESGTSPCQSEKSSFVWIVDPQDGTFEFLQGRRGSAIAVALLRGKEPVLAVVHSPLSPDRGRDTIAWTERDGLLRNGRAIRTDLSGKKIEKGEIVWATASSALRPDTFSRAVMPAHYVAMPSIAYRLARIAAGDGVATLSVHGVNEYDIAAGLALVRAAGGIMLDAEGREVTLSGLCDTRVSGCYAGAPQAALALSKFPWQELEEEPRRQVRTPLGFPRKDGEARLARAQACYLSLFIEKPSEMAVLLARHLAAEKLLDAEKLRATYRDWLQTRPLEVDETTERGLLGLHTAESESPACLERVAPIGIRWAGDPAHAARFAREECALTHPHPLCVESCAAYCAALAAGIAGASFEGMLRAAKAEARGPVMDFWKMPSCAGALQGACRGYDALAPGIVLKVLATRPNRPFELWPDDALELAEALLHVQ